jgi:hypothetical protein
METWDDLFDRADQFAVEVSEISEELRERRRERE